MRKGGTTMKTMKWLAASLAALILVTAAPVGAQSAYYFWWQVVDEQGRPYKQQTLGVGDVQCSVSRPNIHGAAILHSNSSLSIRGETGPLFSDTNGRLHFYSTSGDPVDVQCYAEYGGSASVAKLDRFTHKIVVPRDAAVNITRFPVSQSGSASVYQVDAGASLPQGALIRDVIVQNLGTAAGGGGVLSTYHLSVGFLGNHIVGTSNSVVDRVDLTGFVEWLRPSYINDAGTLAIAATPGKTTHRGAAMISTHAFSVGGNNVTIRFETPYLVHSASGLSLSYSVPATVPLTPYILHVSVYWQKFHTGVNRQPAGQ